MSLWLRGGIPPNIRGRRSERNAPAKAGAPTGAVLEAAILVVVWRLNWVHFFLYPAVDVASCFVIGCAASPFSPTPEESLDGLTIYTLSEQDKPS